VVKGTLAWDFVYLKWFGQTDHPGFLIKILAYIFSILVSNSPRYSTFHAFHIFSVYVQIRSTYSLRMNRFILHIFSIRTGSFCVFSKCPQQNPFEDLSYSAYYPFTSTDSLCIFSVYKQVHFVYSPYMYCTGSFRVFDMCA
jgi:hypothetical protein